MWGTSSRPLLELIDGETQAKTMIAAGTDEHGSAYPLPEHQSRMDEHALRAVAMARIPRIQARLCRAGKHARTQHVDFDRARESDPMGRVNYRSARGFVGRPTAHGILIVQIAGIPIERDRGRGGPSIGRSRPRSRIQRR